MGNINVHIVWFLCCQHLVHESRGVYVLNRAPIVPRVLSEVKVGENSHFERSILAEGQDWLSRVRIQLGSAISS